MIKLKEFWSQFKWLIGFFIFDLKIEFYKISFETEGIDRQTHTHTSYQLKKSRHDEDVLM